MSNSENIGIISETCREIDFEWMINNFLSYTEENSRYSSPCFNVSNSTWKMLIYPNNPTADDSTRCISLFLIKIDDQGKNFTTPRISFGLKTKQSTIVKKRDFTWKTSANDWGVEEFIRRSELQEKKQDLVPSGNLTLVCTIIVNGQDFHEDARLYKLADDYTNLCKSTKNSDLSLKISSETIQAHKCILAARSPVFADMFENDMIENNTEEIDIVDCEIKAFNVFLLYLYSGKVEIGDDCDIFDVYKIADKYDVPELRCMCKDYMIKNMSIENVCETFCFSHQINDKSLQSFIQHFFCENFQAIIVSDIWKSFIKENFNLGNLLLEGMAPKVKIV